MMGATRDSLKMSSTSSTGHHRLNSVIVFNQHTRILQFNFKIRIPLETRNPHGLNSVNPYVLDGNFICLHPLRKHLLCQFLSCPTTVVYKQFRR